jgi:hypothetical protein
VRGRKGRGSGEGADGFLVSFGNSPTQLDMKARVIPNCQCRLDADCSNYNIES